MIIWPKLLGLLLKCAYYQFGHPWMSLSKILQKTSTYLNIIYATLGITTIGLIFYFGITMNIDELKVGGTLFTCLVNNYDFPRNNYY